MNTGNTPPASSSDAQMQRDVPPIRPGDRVSIRVANPADRAACEQLVRDLGAEVLDADTQRDVLMVDEWTPEHDPLVVRARTAGQRVTTLAELLVRDARGPVVAVTGTAGKTSTCRALETIVRNAGRSVRISTTARSANAWPDHSVAGDTHTHDANAVLIAELTSTHLCHMAMPPGPHVAVITTLRADHFDLHPDQSHYVAAKLRLLESQRGHDSVVLPLDDPQTLSAIGPVTAQRWGFGEVVSDVPGAFATPHGAPLLRDAGGTECSVDTFRLTRTQMRAALAAAAAAMAVGISIDDVARALPLVQPPAHRQRVVGTFRGATIVDDTMAATPDKTIAAVQELAGPLRVMVLGGDSCPHPEAQLREAYAAIRASGMRVVAFGPEAPRVCAALDVVCSTPTVMGAVATAATMAGPGGMVIVSPMFPMQPSERDRVAAVSDP